MTGSMSPLGPVGSLGVLTAAGHSSLLLPMTKLVVEARLLSV